MDLLAPELTHYLDQLAEHDHEVARDMETFASQEGFPIVGPVVGRTLYQLTRLHRPTRIFELGSGFGYSAFWFALALRDAGLERGRVVLTDGSEQRLELARDHLERAGLDEHCEYRHGDALEILSQDDGPDVDLFFMDIDKHGYPDALDPMLARLRPGGLIIVDNMLWSGRPIALQRGDDEADTPATRGVAELTRRLFTHPSLFTTMLPLRDGVTVSLRI